MNGKRTKGPGKSTKKSEGRTLVGDRPRGSGGAKGRGAAQISAEGPLANPAHAATDRAADAFLTAAAVAHAHVGQTERPAALSDAAQSCEPKATGLQQAKADCDAPAQAKPNAEAKERAEPPREAPSSAAPFAVDFAAFSTNAARLMEETGKVVAALTKPRETVGTPRATFAEEVEDAVRSLGNVAEYWLADPGRAVEAHALLSTQFVDLWGQTFRRLSGESAAPVVASDPADKRFSAPEWGDSPLFDFLRQAHALTTHWATDIVARSDGIDALTKDKAKFWVRQIAGATSPSNFVATNPILLKQTLAENGENLLRGMQLLAEDIEIGKGDLKIRQSDSSKLELGRDMAATPGKVVLRNDLIELIQYAPTTETVRQRPLLIVPPWINKYYVLDLNREKSFVRWMVDQGLTVFLISWVNPDARHRDKGFDAYMHEGVLAAVDAVLRETGAPDVSAMGYCVGGTMLSATLAWLAARGDRRIASATLLTTQVDFTDPGDLKVFADEQTIAMIEQRMSETGYLDGAKMASAFNMLRPEDLIWSYVVNNYVKGKAPAPFDLLSWNSDSARMTAANHSWYMRNCYLENNLTQGRMTLSGTLLDLLKVTVPVYNLAAKEDHIAPAASVFRGATFFGGPMRYVLAGSGHIAGVVNPATKPKYQYWTGPQPSGSFDTWAANATEHPGSWWVDWRDWILAQSHDEVAARRPGQVLEPLADAPGTYVRVKS